MGTLPEMRPIALVLSILGIGFALGSAGCHVVLAGLIMESAKSKGAYEPGAIAKDLGPDAVRTLACLDIGLAIHEKDETPLLELDVGNRCVHNEPFELNEMLIRAQDAEGQEQKVGLVDPRDEIGPVHIGPLEHGHERIRLRGLGGVEEICFELTGVVPDAPHTRAAPLCLLRHGRAWIARSFS